MDVHFALHLDTIRFILPLTNVMIHNVRIMSCCRDVNLGDVAIVGECRPLSKTVRFNVLKVTKGAGSKKGFKKF